MEENLEGLFYGKKEKKPPQTLSRHCRVKAAGHWRGCCRYHYMPALVSCASQGARYQRQEPPCSDNTSEIQKHLPTLVASDN